MTQDPPASEEELLWRKRFGLFALLRLTGLAMMIVGLAIAVSDFIRPGGWPLVGGAIAIIGFIDAMVVPIFLRRRWGEK